MRGSGKSMMALNHVLFHMSISETAIYDEYQRLHSTDGPAAVLDGVPIWSIGGTFMKFDEWCKETDKTKKEKALLLLKYKTNIANDPVTLEA